MISHVRTGSGIWWAAFSKHKDAEEFAYNNAKRFKHGLFVQHYRSNNMPCSDSGGPAHDERSRDRLQHANNRLTVLLCAACRVLVRQGQYDFDENPELSEWWARHQWRDAASR